jgi:hypothetical protein
MKLVQNTVPAPFTPRATLARAPSKLVPRRQLPTLLVGETPLQRLARWLGRR